MRAFVALLILGVAHMAFAADPAARATSETYLYRVELVQAAPGKVTELIDLYNRRAAGIEEGGDLAPFWMRHSQGDHWDLLLLYPMGSYTEYYSGERVERRKRAEDAAANLAGRIRQDIAWQEDVFVYGPALDAVKAAFANAGFFHVEMLRALPGRPADLHKEREMESAYQKALHRPELFLFVRDHGAAWDILSIDFYRDLKQYAESVDIPPPRNRTPRRARPGTETQTRSAPIFGA